MRLAFSMVLVLLIGCAQQQHISDPALYTHVIDIDSAGNPVHPVNFERMNATEYERQLGSMFEDIQTWCKDWEKAHPDPTDKPKLLIFVHGGMVSEADAIERAHSQWQSIRDAGYYPIFITWDSDPGSAYGEHLFHVRHGALVSGGVWSAPLYFIADLGRALFGAPIVWVDSFTHDFNRIGADLSAVTHHDAEGNPDLDRRWTDNPEEQHSVLLTGYLRDQYTSPATRSKAMPISVGTYSGQPGDSFFRAVTWVLFWPVKLVTAPVIDGLGHPMWENMSRRTNIMYEGAGITELRRAPAPRRHPRAPSTAAAATTQQTEQQAAQQAEGREILEHLPGAMPAFLEHLRKFAAHQSGAESRCQITLVGHSMGCIVLDEFIRRTPQSLEYQQIVYMAAACTVRDFERTVIPYLHAHHDSRFYNLCLHPANDVRERHAVDLIPRGSLLVWLDDFLAEPRTPLDRMLGRWDNVVEAAWIVPEELRPRVNLKMFNLGYNDKATPYNPQSHGDFSLQPFWEPAFFTPLPPEAEPTRTDKAVRQSIGEINARREKK